MHLRQERGDFRVLYTSGYTEDTIIHHGGVMPSGHFIAKPFRGEALAKKIRQVMTE